MKSAQVPKCYLGLELEFEGISIYWNSVQFFGDACRQLLKWLD